MPQSPSDQLLPILHADIWRQILLHVLRDPPVPNSLSVPHEICHQQNLTVCMRVNSEFHAIAGPILYRDIYVYDLSLLFDGFEVPPEWLEAMKKHVIQMPSRTASLPVKNVKRTTRTNKRGLLGFTESLNLLYRPDLSEDSLKDLLYSEERDSWAQTGRNEEDKIHAKRFRVESELWGCGPSITLYHTEVTRNGHFFTRLTKVTFGIVDDGFWYEMEGWIRAGPGGGGDGVAVPRKLLESLWSIQEHLIAAICKKPSVRSICIFSAGGPYSLPPGTFCDLGKRQTSMRLPVPTIFRHINAKLSPGIIQIVLGFKNIFSYNSRSHRANSMVNLSAGVVNPSYPASVAAMFGSVLLHFGLSSIAALPDDYLLDTEIVLHGLTPFRTINEVYPNFNRQFQHIIQSHGLDYAREMAVRKVEEKDRLAMEMAKAKLGTGEVQRIHEIITIRSMISTPACPGCGLEDRYEC